MSQPARIAASRGVLAFLVSIVAALALAQASKAQCTPVWESFPPGTVGGFLQEVSVLCVDEAAPGGPLLHAGGGFRLPDGSFTTIASWDGAVWRPLGTGVDTHVSTLCMFDADGPGPNPAELIAGGSFTVAGGVAANGVAKWNGTTWSPLGAGTNGAVFALTVFDEDGLGPNAPALFVGGSFTTAGGASANRMARWDGATWSALGSGMDTRVAALTVFDEDGAGPLPSALFAGGSFTTAGGSGASSLARWSGGAWSAVGGGVDADVFALTVFDDDDAGPHAPRLIAGGLFGHAGGNPAVRIASWDGSAWSPLGLGVDGGPFPSVLALAVFDEDGAGPGLSTLCAGGGLSSAGGASANFVARWDGSQWSTLASGPCPTEPGNHVASLVPFDDDGTGPHPARLLVGGTYEWDGGLAHATLAAWDGADWSYLGAGMNGSVHALSAYDDDGAGPNAPALVAGGDFYFAGGALARGVARWNGDAWSGFDSGMIGTSGPGVRSLAVFDDDAGGPDLPELIAAGWFGSAGGVLVGSIAAWNGSAWSALPGAQIDPSPSPEVTAMVVFDEDGSGPTPAVLFASGLRIASQPGAFGLLRWNGHAWSAVGGGLAGRVHALASFDEDAAGPGAPALFAAGEFLVAGGVPVSHVARWNGTSWSDVGGGVDAAVFALAVFDDDDAGPNPPALHAGGAFTIAGGVGASHVAKWSGAAWSSVGIGTSANVRALIAFDADGAGPDRSTLVAGGDFTSAGGVSANRIARWDGALWSSLGAGTNGVVRALCIFDDDGSGAAPNSVFVGGTFNSADNQTTANLARWAGCASTLQPFCFGDGSSGPCPCPNVGATGRGCPNSSFASGAQLLVAGNASLGQDTVVLSTSSVTGPACIFFQGTNVIAPLPIDDGLGCVGGALIRLGTKPVSAKASSYPQSGDARVSVRGQVPPPGATRYYQVFYRNAAPGFCAPATSNRTNGVAISWSY
ncbi:MAG: hypothetical protein IPJ77_06850 [Planctomycetes bacterium]|nr:hypothetical protein [Planctomycetota bacterium]